MLSILTFFLLAITPYIFAEQGETEKVRFRWAFVALKQGDGGEKLVPVTRDMTLETGDQLKIYLELEKKCFVYVFYHGSQDELQLLFPYYMPMFTTDYVISKKYYIPQGTFWLALDENTGLEKFLLLGSAQRLNELERLYGEYTAAVDSTKKQKLAKQVLDEIRNIKRKHVRLATTPERPVQIAGSIRGIGKNKEGMQFDLSNMAVEVSATNFYSRTFTIDHQ
jgi:hypothetical protein